jgi:hypothetical protein
VEVVPGATPNGVALPGGGPATFTKVFSGIYRTTANNPTDCTKPLMEFTIDMTWVPPLPPGQYWVLVSGNSTNPGSEYVPPTVPWDATDNAQLSVNFGPFAPTIGGMGGAPMDLPFELSGIDGSGDDVTQYCTQTKPTSVPGCSATLMAFNTTLSAGSWRATDIPSAAPATVVGIFIYTHGLLIGQSAVSVGVPFGTLCLAGFKRSAPACAPAVLAAAAGCNPGPMTLELNCNGGALGISVLDDVNVQLWHRDPTAPGTANLSNAIFYTVQ